MTGLTWAGATTVTVPAHTAADAPADDEGDDETVAGPIAIAVDMNEGGDTKPAGGDNPDS